MSSKENLPNHTLLGNYIVISNTLYENLKNSIKTVLTVDLARIKETSPTHKAFSIPQSTACSPRSLEL